MKVTLQKPISDEYTIHGLVFNVVEGYEYTVFGLFSPDGVEDSENIYICIMDDRYDSSDSDSNELYPVWLPLKNFKITNPKIPNDWQISYWDTEISGYLTTFAEWSTDNSFYYWLVDGRRQEANIFKKYFDLYV